MSESLHNMFYGTPPVIHARARLLRNKETPAEKKLWDQLSNKQLGVKFRRQHPIDQFIVDFYSHEIKLVIEADGEIHSEKERQDYDRRRTEHLKAFGLNVLRFKNAEILNNISAVIEQIKVRIAETSEK